MWLTFKSPPPTLSGAEDMPRPKKVVIKFHPLLDELRPRLSSRARRSLRKSLDRVGQLHEVLVTIDGYILDGRERFELLQEMGLVPRTRTINCFSGQGELPPGYEKENELELCLEVIEETGRGKWRDSANRREADHELVKQAPDHELVKQAPDHELVKRLPRIELLESVLLHGKPIGIRFQRQLLEHLRFQAIKQGASRQMGRSKTKVPSLPQYIRKLCWQDYLKHLGDEDPDLSDASAAS